MRWDVVRENESLNGLSSRLGVPGCMLLRANRLYSPAWLLPGREVAVPEADFCLWDSFRCPAEAMRCPAREQLSREEVTVREGDTVRQLARRRGIPERLVYRVAGRSGGTLPAGLRLKLPIPPERCALVNVLPGMGLEALARQYGAQALEIQQLNALWGPLLPGMRVLIPLRR